MPTPRILGAVPRDTPAELQSAGGRVSRLPDDLLRQATKRLQILALVAAALWVLGPSLGHLATHFADPTDPSATQFRVLDGIAVFAFATSIGLYLYLRTARPDPAFVIDLGLGYLVLTAIDLGVMIHFGVPAGTQIDTHPIITWIGPVILMTAAIVPAEPRKMAVAALVAASMDPLGMLIGRAAGVYQFGSVMDTLAMHYPNYLIAGVGVVISGVVTRLGQQVRRAREMGSYRLGDLLGHGGMGEVYLAHHRMLARPAAIKLIRPETLAGTDGSGADLAVARFRREAEAAARLKSPHSVRLYDFGVTDEGRLYLVMELLEGITLDALVRQDGPLPAARVARILHQVCESLEEAHDAGLVHRDIKPANIHLGRVGRHDDFVKVLDFGLVKCVAGGDLEDSLATAGITLGTPGYMAPELAQSETVDGRADLYSLGCVAYYLLTGQQVFQGETALQTIVMHLQREPVPPSQRTDNPVPATLEGLVLACLAKRPEDRPQNAAELAAALTLAFPAIALQIGGVPHAVTGAPRCPPPI
jgi:eukaryotic-like serine/threonine-protein kinase